MVDLLGQCLSGLIIRFICRIRIWRSRCSKQRSNFLTSLIPDFKGKRWLKVFLRTSHLLGFAGVFASVLTGNSYDYYWMIAITSGLGLLLLDSLSNLVWFVQIRALAIYVKLILLICLFIFPDYALHCLILMIIISGVVSHASSNIRYYSIYHGRKITSLNDTKG